MTIVFTRCQINDTILLEIDGGTMKIDIICPLYNAEKYVLELDKSLKKQKKVTIKNIFYLMTESKDHTEEILKKHKIKYTKVNRKDDYNIWKMN